MITLMNVRIMSKNKLFLMFCFWFICTFFHMLSKISHFFFRFSFYIDFLWLFVTTWFKWFFAFLYYFQKIFDLSFYYYRRRIVLTFFEICLHFVINFDFAYTFDFIDEMNISIIACIIFIKFFICRFIFFVLLLHKSSIDANVSLIFMRVVSFSRKVSTSIFFQFLIFFELNRFRS